MKPDVVPDRLENKINYWVVLLIIGLTISFQIALYYINGDEITDQIIYFVSIVNPLSATLASFMIAKRYSSTMTFGRAYLALTCGFLSITIGEILYFVYEAILQIEPYPSPADIFFFLQYPFVLLHLIINTRFFKPKIHVRELLWMVLIPTSIISLYISSSLSQIGDANFDFYYGLIFAMEPAIVLPFAILGAKTFKGGILGPAWLILVIAIISFTIGDVWYYYLEIFGNYDLLHPVNLFWYAGYWIIVYALFKHKKSI